MSFAGLSAVDYDYGLNFQRRELADFYAYWDRKRGDRLFPSRADIEPREFVAILPWVHMYDVINAGEEFTVRLAGTALADFFSESDFRGKPISMLPEPAGGNLRRHLLNLLEARAPLRTYNHSTSIPGQELCASEGCYVPLSGNGADIDIIMAVTLLGDTRSKPFF